MTYHGFKRHFTSHNVNMSQGLTALLNSFVSKEKGKFLDSKMSLWKWLRDKTLNGHTYYAYGKEAALDSIIYRLLESMPEDLQQKFSLKTNYSQSCSYDPNHDSLRTFRHNVFPVSADDVLDEHLLQDSDEFDVIQVIKHKLTLRNFMPTSKCSVLIQNDQSNAIDSDCAIISDPKTCGAMLQQSTTVLNQPDIFFVGYTGNSSKGYTPNLDKENTIDINGCMYKLTGIVYLKSHHYWCEVYSSQKKYKNGWFVYNGLWNNGKATFVGSKPLFLEKESLYLLMFEKVATQHTNCTNGVTFQQLNTLNDNQVIKRIIEDHKNLLMLKDNKASLTNIKAILQHYSISTQSNQKIADLKELLLKQCNSFSSVPITFVPDCSVENYIEAPERNHSNLPHKQLNDFVPVTFVNDSMINMVKTQETVTETAGIKRLNLTPVKHGYTPERHPTKKQKGSKPTHDPPRKLKISVRDEATEDLSFKQSPEIKSFKEMVAALQKDTLSSSDSAEEFESDFKLLDSSEDLFFQKFDEPTENEKQKMCAKSYMSDLFDQTYDYQMVKTTELWEYREFDRSLTPKLGNDFNHLE